MIDERGLGRWLKDKGQNEHLLLRQAGNKAGQSHSTVDAITRGS